MKWLGCLAVILFTVSGCASPGSPPESTPSPPAVESPAATPSTTDAPFSPQSNPVAVAQRFYDAVLAGDDEIICALVTPKYRDALTRSQSAASCPEAAGKAFSNVRAQHQQTKLEYKALDTRISADGQSAVVRVSGSVAPQKGKPKPSLSYVNVPLVRQGEGWLVDPPTQAAAPPATPA